MLSAGALDGAGVTGVSLARLKEVRGLDRVQGHPKSRVMRFGSGSVPSLLGDF